MQRYAGLGSERYCWREGSVIDDLRYVHGFGIERNSSVRGVQIQSIRQRSRALTFRFSWGGEFGGGPASAGPPPKFPGPSVVMFPTFYGHSRTLSGQTHLFVSQKSRQRRTIASSVQAKPASQKVFFFCDPLGHWCPRHRGGLHRLPPRTAPGRMRARRAVSKLAEASERPT